MARNKKEDGSNFDLFDGVAGRGGPTRPRASSGTQLSAPSPSLTMPNGARRTLPGMGDGSPTPGTSAPAPSSTQVRRHVDVVRDDDDEVTHEFVDEVTHEFVETATLVEEEESLDDDKTKDLPRRVVRPVPAPTPVTAPAPTRPRATLLGLTPPSSPAPVSSRAPLPPSTPGPTPPRSVPPQRPVASLPPWAPTPPRSAPSSSPSMRPGSVPDYAAPVIRVSEVAPAPRPRLGLSHLAAALAGGAVLVLLVELKPSQGQIVVNASDSHGGPVNRLSVFVDGEKTACATAPCYLPSETGAHEVKIIAEGFDVPAVQGVAVKSGDSVVVNFMLGSSSSGSGIKISGAQAGVKLFIDQKEVGPLPQVVRDLAPGDHVIRLAGSERYQPIERHVTVERDKVSDLGTINLKVLKGNVTVKPGTAGARVFISSGSERRELPVLPISLDIDTAKLWSLEAIMAGYDSYRQPIAFDDGVADKTFTVTLEPKAGGAPAAAAEPVSAPTPVYQAPTPPVYTPPAPPTPRAAPVSGGDAPAAAGAAYLNINSIPPSTCILDGKALGATPRMHVSVTPGSHTVKFVDSDDGLSQTIFVNVGAGETKLAVAKLN